MQHPRATCSLFCWKRFHRTWSTFRQINVVRVSIAILISSHWSSTHFNFTLIHKTLLIKRICWFVKNFHSASIEIWFVAMSNLKWNLLVPLFLSLWTNSKKLKQLKPNLREMVVCTEWKTKSAEKAYGKTMNATNTEQVSLFVLWALEMKQPSTCCCKSDRYESVAKGRRKKKKSRRRREENEEEPTPSCSARSPGMEKNKSARGNEERCRWWWWCWWMLSWLCSPDEKQNLLHISIPAACLISLESWESKQKEKQIST